MPSDKNVSINVLFWIFTALIMVLFTHASVAHSNERLLAWPVSEDLTKLKFPESLQAHEVRKGRMIVAPELLPGNDVSVGQEKKNAPVKGDTLSIQLFNDVKHDVKIDSVKHHADGTMIINGKLKNHDHSTMVMTIGKEEYLITVQDMNTGMLYRVRGNSRDGSGSVTEIDMKKMPPMIR